LKIVSLNVCHDKRELNDGARCQFHFHDIRYFKKYFFFRYFKIMFMTKNAVHDFISKQNFNVFSLFFRDSCKYDKTTNCWSHCFLFFWYFEGLPIKGNLRCKSQMRHFYFVNETIKAPLHPHSSSRFKSIFCFLP
jgi:hypothetical protein